MSSKRGIDPFNNPELAPTDAAGRNKNGARYGCSRKNGVKWHGGLDLKAKVGTRISAIHYGVVQKLEKDNPTPGCGKYIIIKNTTIGVSILYCHLDEVNVTLNQNISQGEYIGTTGVSGNASNVPHPHLHLEVSENYFKDKSKNVDPEDYIMTQFGPNKNKSNKERDCPDK